MLRSALVNNSLICDVSASCGMHHILRYHHHEAMTGPGRARRGMLADSFEAFIGAMFIDKQPLGLAAVKIFANTMVFCLTQRTVEERRWMDPKSRLQYCLTEFNQQQERENVARGQPPGTAKTVSKRYCVLDEWGPSHQRMYQVGCYVNGDLVATARAQSFSDGQQGASLRAQEALFIDDYTAGATLALTWRELDEQLDESEAADTNKTGPRSTGAAVPTEGSASGQARTAQERGELPAASHPAWRVLENVN